MELIVLLLMIRFL